MNERNFTDTEESVFTLLALSTQITQAFDAIYGNKDRFNTDFTLSDNYNDLLNETIYDALHSHIILKSVAFIDEWNNYFGVITNNYDKDKVMLVKKIARPAYKCICEWTELNSFRNQVIAHALRDNKKRNIYLNGKKFNKAPQTPLEIYLLASCIHIISRVISYFFQEEVFKMAVITHDNIQKSKLESIYRPYTDNEKEYYINRFKMISDEIDMSISNIDDSNW